MKLGNLLTGLGNRPEKAFFNLNIGGICCHSKEVKPGDIFVAIKGDIYDGHQFIPEAIKRGAKAIVLEGSRYPLSAIRYPLPFISVPDTRKALAKLAARFYNYPSRKIKLIGITGTNGKTTISHLVFSILKEANLDCGLIGTLGYRYRKTHLPGRHTTPDSLIIHSLLDKMSKKGINYVAMEVSSHSLAQERVEGLNFEVGIFSNLDCDHLDYHKTKNAYFSEKAKLFAGLSKSNWAVINIDDSWGRRLLKLTSSHILSYGINSGAKLRAEEIKVSQRGTEFFVVHPEGRFPVSTCLLGRHNLYNILASIGGCLCLGIRESRIKAGIERLKSVPGRLERIPYEGAFKVYIDYAHTEGALREVLFTLRGLTKGKIILLFGCGGNRDKTKRPRMGRVASGLADFVVITSDNPRNEDPSIIAKEIEKGMAGNNYEIILDRKEAIKRAICLARDADTVLIAGKGHENYQIFKDKRIFFDDREAAREVLRELGYVCA